MNTSLKFALAARLRVPGIPARPSYSYCCGWSRGTIQPSLDPLFPDQFVITLGLEVIKELQPVVVAPCLVSLKPFVQFFLRESGNWTRSRWAASRLADGFGGVFLLATITNVPHFMKRVDVTRLSKGSLRISALILAVIAESFLYSPALAAGSVSASSPLQFFLPAFSAALSILSPAFSTALPVFSPA